MKDRQKLDLSLVSFIPLQGIFVITNFTFNSMNI